MSEQELPGGKFDKCRVNSQSESVFSKQSEDISHSSNVSSEMNDTRNFSFEKDENEVSGSKISPEVSSNDSDFEMESDRRLLNERPFISARFSKPYDPIQPRGGNAISRIPPGYSCTRFRGFGDGLDVDEEEVSGSRDKTDADSSVGAEENPSSSRLPSGRRGSLNVYRDRNIADWRNRTHDAAEFSNADDILQEEHSRDYFPSRTRWNGGYRGRGMKYDGNYSRRSSYDSTADFNSAKEGVSPQDDSSRDVRQDSPVESGRGIRRTDRYFQGGNVSDAHRYSRKPYPSHRGNYGGRRDGETNEWNDGYYSGGHMFGRENYGKGFRDENLGEGGVYGAPGDFDSDAYAGYHGRNSNRRFERKWNASNGGGASNYGRGGRPYRRNQNGYSSFNPAFPELNSPRSQREPLSLAEELAEEMTRGSRNPAEEGSENMEREILLQDETVGRLQKLSVKELIEEARRFEIGIPDEEHAKKHDLIFQIIKEKIKLNGLLYGEGTLEILPDGFGFLRSTDYHYLSCPDDIYVSPSQIRRFGLKTGTVVSGQIRPPKENERYFALLRVEAINYRDPNEFSHKKRFDDLAPTHPVQRLNLESDADEIEMRVLDMMLPVGLGQRGLIVSPPQAGKTKFLENVAKAALKNYSDLYVFILLVDERPADVEEMRRQVKGMNCEVICSTFDEPVLRHIQVADMVLEKAKRMVEYGRDVLILLDSISHLARAWSAESFPYGGEMPMEMGMNVLQVPKRFFASARCVEEGGSLTILATLLSETENEVDQMILEEFRGTGDLEIVLDKRLLEKNIFPPIDLTQSGTRHEEMLLSEEEFRSLSKLRRILYELNPLDAMELLTNRLKKTKTNAEFLSALSGGDKKTEETGSVEPVEAKPADSTESSEQKGGME